MRRSLPFVASAAAIVSVGALLSWPFLSDPGRYAVTVAGLLVLGTQVPLHLAMQPWRSRNDRFLAAILVGFLSRLAVIVVGVVGFVIPGRVAPGPFLMALGALLVLTLFAESLLEQRLHGARKESAAA